MHKDGIRRAVVTNMGSALARYFDKQDLKQIFKLNPPGQCDFLDRLGEKGCTRDSDIFHRGVIGISSHDVLYTEDADITTENSDLQVGVNSQDNPFSSPTKAAHLTLHEVAGLESTKGIVRALGKSQRVMNKESMKKVNDLIPLRKLGDQTNNKTIRQAKSNIKENRSNQSIKKNIQDFLIAADRLSASGRREDAMEILMDAMDALYNDLDKVQKKQLHLRMSSIAYELRWL